MNYAVHTSRHGTEDVLDFIIDKKDVVGWDMYGVQDLLEEGHAGFANMSSGTSKYE